MNILIIGSGGREHALAWKAAQSPLVENVFVAPGNAGTALEAGVENLDVAADDIDGLLAAALEKTIDLTIVGPEAALVTGVVDRFSAAGLKCFGPIRRAARLEGSKAFAKEFMQRHEIPTAASGSFSDLKEALEYLRKVGAPIVIKADGLAAGKGVILAQDLDSAEAALKQMLAGNRFGEAGQRVLIEEFLSGEEASFMVMADGRNILPLASSQDHKARDDGDQGPNTGGMGAYSPAPVVSPEMHERIMERIIRPTIEGMASEGHAYSGFLYAGVMIDQAGNPRVLEYNCRLGDPETQPILLRMQSDLVAHCLATLEGKLDEEEAEWDDRAALGVVLAAGGYPDDYRTGDVIEGLPEQEEPGQKVFHAGTALADDKVVTAGGRVLCATALGSTVAEAQTRAYELARRIHWDGIYFRSDIGYRAVAREQGNEAS